MRSATRGVLSPIAGLVLFMIVAILFGILIETVLGAPPMTRPQAAAPPLRYIAGLVSSVIAATLAGRVTARVAGTHERRQVLIVAGLILLVGGSTFLNPHARTPGASLQDAAGYLLSALACAATGWRVARRR